MLKKIRQGINSNDFKVTFYGTLFGGLGGAWIAAPIVYKIYLNICGH